VMTPFKLTANNLANGEVVMRDGHKVLRLKSLTRCFINQLRRSTDQNRKPTLAMN
jgi:hypothetical protein